MSDPDAPDRGALLRARLAALEDERQSLQRELVALKGGPRHESVGTGSVRTVTASSPAKEKIALFRGLFAGRLDVFPVRWRNAKTGKSGYAPPCANEWKPGVCYKPRVKCGECPNHAFIPVSDHVIRRHLSGARGAPAAQDDYVAGVYPLLPDDTCRFLVADFDGDEWPADARAYLHTCRLHNVPAALERSRSGSGGHVWIFFAEPVPAALARRLGALLLTDTMERRPEIGFASYDRFFPSQDRMPLGGFGNLIALPLQHRARQRGNSVFVDDDLRPHDDQWAFLSSLSPISRAAVKAMVDTAEAAGQIVGVRTPVEDDHASEPWLAPPSRRQAELAVTEPLPPAVDVVSADGLYVDRRALPPPMVTRLVRLAAFQNPEFFRAQAMRLSTYGKPRIISCAELHPHHVALPRGCLDEVSALFRSHRVEIRLTDHRETGIPLEARFTGILREDQALAASALAGHDTGVLAAATAFGKTIVAAWLIAERRCSTLILVHRRELLAQWVERLGAFLSVDPSEIGIIGAGRRKPTGKIDVALIQSLVRKGVVSDAIAGYGHLVVDECHHVSAASFELVARRSKARYVLGLSATVTRRDGHHPIILMQCGPIRYRVSDKEQVKQRSIDHRVLIRETTFRLPLEMEEASPSISSVYAALAQDAERNQLILEDLRRAVASGHAPLVLTERRNHLEMLARRLDSLTGSVVVLHGGMKVADRRVAYAKLLESAPRVVLSTGRYLGEGFDDARLDMLFLAMPISWRGTLAQYVGRLHREYGGKREVVVYDYVDGLVPVLRRMAVRRQSGYRALGYAITP